MLRMQWVRWDRDRGRLDAEGDQRRITLVPEGNRDTVRGLDKKDYDASRCRLPRRAWPRHRSGSKFDTQQADRGGWFQFARRNRCRIQHNLTGHSNAREETVLTSMRYRIAGRIVAAEQTGGRSWMERAGHGHQDVRLHDRSERARGRRSRMQRNSGRVVCFDGG